MKKRKKATKFTKQAIDEKKQGTEVIRLKDLSRFYYMGSEVVKALCGINLKILQGEFVSIMGPSGSGKSTAMNLIGSLDAPTKGHVYLDGIDISTLEESDLAQIRGRRIGFIFQSFNLIQNLTAKQNVMLPLMFQGMDEQEREQRAEEVLKLVELGDRIDHYPNELSGGQQQRVAIARALANNPEVVLADEPTGNLDTKTGEIVMEFLEKLHKQGRTIVMITHDPDLAKDYSEVIYWLVDGQVQKVTKKQGKKWVKLKVKKLKK